MKRKISPPQVIALGFFIIILIGAILLMLPISSRDNSSANIIVALFTSTSAVCVTGLAVNDTAIYWSTFGQTIILFLIQIGGIGFMTIATFGAILIGKKIGITDRLIIKEAINHHRIQGLVKLIKTIIIGSFLIESLGALFLAFVFIPEYGFYEGLRKSIFHSISAFCNAGFDIIGSNNSLSNFNSNVIVNIVICLLIILGGIGFAVILDIIDKKRFKRFNLHTKIVVVLTLFLIVFSTVVFLLLEYNNPKTIGDLPIFFKLQSSFFQSVTTRTAGFCTINQAYFTDSSQFFTMMLMLIGGAPASTAGGIKVTTLTVVILMAIAFVKSKDAEIYGRRISSPTVNKAMTIIVIAFFVIVCGTMILSIENPNIPFISIFFEVISAFGTVGLSVGITNEVTNVSKIVLMIIMYAGRVGALTVIMAFSSKKRKNNYKLPEGNVIL